jgi:tetratricopeptide (TPR) repeat protein
MITQNNNITQYFNLILTKKLQKIMKKISILSLCLVSGMAVSAQKAVVKEATSAMKSGKEFTEVVKIMTPAFSDSETSNQVDTYYVPGKAGFKQYDDLLGKKQFGMLPEGGAVTMANALIGGYDYFLKALPLDSLPDEKGKVKPKYSKDIINTVAGHYSDFNVVAVDFWNAKDYDGAYRAWDIFLTLPKNATFAKEIKAFPDSTNAEVSFNQALAAWQADKFDNAIKSFRNAIALGYNKKAIYEYGIAVATGAKDNDALLEFASQGNSLYGSEDSQFLNQIINYYLQTEKYDEAVTFLEKGISENPSNAQYYALAGIIYDNKDDREKAITYYTKALELDPENGLANFYQGRALAAKAGKLGDDYNGQGYDQYKAQTIDPIYKQAAELLEKAYQVDPNNRSQILQVLQIVYYNLNDESGLESAKQRSQED